MQTYAKSLHRAFGYNRFGRTSFEHVRNPIILDSCYFSGRIRGDWLDNNYRRMITTPVYDEGTEEIREDMLEIGCEFKSSSDPNLNWLMDMGYVQRKKLSRLVIVGECRDVHDLVYGILRKKPLYHYEVLLNIPSWSKDFIRLLPTFVPDEHYVKGSVASDYWDVRDSFMVADSDEDSE
jgi:hypothetical protein